MEDTHVTTTSSKQNSLNNAALVFQCLLKTFLFPHNPALLMTIKIFYTSGYGSSFFASFLISEHWKENPGA